MLIAANNRPTTHRVKHRFFAVHKEAGMVDVRHRKCETCDAQPTDGYRIPVVAQPIAPSIDRQERSHRLANAASNPTAGNWPSSEFSSTSIAQNTASMSERTSWSNLVSHADCWELLTAKGIVKHATRKLSQGFASQTRAWFGTYSLRKESRSQLLTG
ncbi:hypothetical protein HDU86_007229 [Geranomyces michiganensis]|nr:hypothetical protein HDU86_007229 [Geranomyces michiganensis]